MGAYMTKPVTDVEAENGADHRLSFSAGSMQGWRMTQEDAHMCLLEFDTDSALFGVFDGHGGSEVAQYCAKHFPNFFKKLSEYQLGDFESALKKGFVSFDATLLNEEVIKELRLLRGDEIDTQDSKMDLIQDSIALQEEANLPIEELLAKYGKTAADLVHPIKPPSSNGEGSSGSPTKRRETPSTTEDKVAGDQDSDKKLDVHPVPLNGDASAPAPTSTHEGNGDVELKAEGDVKVKAEESVEKSVEKSEKESPEPKKVDKGKGRKITPIKVPVEPKNLYEEFLKDFESDSSDGESDFEHQSTDSEGEEEEEEEDSGDSGDDDEEEWEDEDECDDKEVSLTECQDDEPGKDSGCTAVVALIKGDKLYVANAGDSRCVVSKSGEAIEMTFDHKPEDEVEISRIHKAGGKVSLDGRVNGGLNLSRAIGDHVYKTNTNLSLEEQMISPLPDIKVLDLNPEHDFMIIACDGIWNSMSSQEVVTFIKERIDTKSNQEIIHQLFHTCLAEDTCNDGTGCDNMTAIIVDLRKYLDEHKVNNGVTNGVLKRKASGEEEAEPLDKKVKDQV